MKYDEMSLVNFIADCFRVKGQVISTHWLATDEALREKAIDEVFSAFERWKNKELAAQAAREAGMKAFLERAASTES